MGCFFVDSGIFCNFAMRTARQKPGRGFEGGPADILTSVYQR